MMIHNRLHKRLFSSIGVSNQATWGDEPTEFLDSALSRLLIYLTLGLISLFWVTSANAQKTGSTGTLPTTTTLTTTATVVTDTTNYSPGSTIYISADGFLPGEAVALQVALPDGTIAEPGSWVVNANAGGGFATSWIAPLTLIHGETLELTASGATSALLARTSFSSSNTSLVLSGFAADTIFCPDDPDTPDSIRVCATLYQECHEGAEYGIAGKPILFFLNPGNCGVDVAQVGDTVWTDSAGEACYTFALPAVDDVYSIRAKFREESMPQRCSSPGNSQCPSRSPDGSDDCVNFSSSNDCLQFGVSSEACFTSPPLVCIPDTAIALCGPQEICLGPILGGSGSAGSLTVSYGQIRGDSLCFTPDTAGTYTLVVTSSDGQGTQSCTTSVTVSYNSPPQIVVSSVSERICSVGETVSFTVNGFDPDFDPLVWSLVSGAGSISESGVITFQPDASGDYCFVVRLADDCGYVEDTACATVIVNQPPEIYEYSDTVTVCDDDTLCFVVAGFDRDFGDSVVITQVSGPGVFAMTTDTSGVTCFSVKKVTGVTTYNFGYEIVDQCLAGAPQVSQWTVSVTVIPSATPVVKLPKNFEYFRCEPTKVCVSATVNDPDNDLAIIGSNLGVYDAQMGEVCFQSSAGAADTLIVSATDSCGLIGADTVIITYVEPQPLSVVCPIDTTVFVCDSGEVCVPFPALSPDWTLDLRPSSVRFDSASGNVCFTASQDLTKQITAIITNGCEVDTCVFNVTVNVNSSPNVTSPVAIDTFLCSANQLCWTPGISDADSNIASIQVSSPASYNAVDGSVCLQIDTTGSYEIVTTVTDECGAVSADTTVVNATVNSAPEVTAGADLTMSLCAPEAVCVMFNISDRDQNITQITTNIGSYDPKSGLVCVTPDTAGVYKIVTTAIDDCGAVSEDTATLTIHLNEAPLIDLGADTSVFLCSSGEICIPVAVPNIPGNDNLESVFTTLGVYNKTTGLICFVPSADGAYVIIATATDACGLAYTDTVTVTVSQGRPASIKCPADTVALSVCGQDSASYSLSIVPPDAQVTVTGGSYANGVLTFAAGASGVYTTQVAASNDCGSDSCEIAFNVTVGKDVKLKCPTDTTVFTCLAGDKVSIPVGLSAKNADVSVTPTGVYQNGQVVFNADTAGVYALSVVASTSCGTDTCSVNVTVLRNTAPVVFGPADTTIFICDRAKLYFPFAATDVDGNLMSVTTTPGHIQNDSVCIDVSGPGQYTLIVSATDSCGESAADTSIVTITANTPPVVTLPGDVTDALCADSQLCFPVSVSDAEGNVVSLVASGGTLEQGDSVLCIATSGSGVYSAIVIAADECGATSADTITVTMDVNRPPRVKLALLNDQFICEQKKQCLGVTITDENLDTVIVQGADYDPVNERVCFTPDTSGLYTIMVTAIDTCGVAVADTTSATLIINTPPKVVAPTDTMVATCVGGTVCFAVDIFDEEGNISAVAVSGGVNAMYSDGQVCFDPDSSGVYFIVVSAVDSCGAGAADTTRVTVLQNQPPAITLQDSLALQCATTETCVPIDITDLDNNIDTVIIVGARYDALAGVICVDPADTSVTAVIVTVVDACGVSVSDTMKVSVNNGAPITLVCPPDTGLFICEPDTLCFPISGIPAGASIEFIPQSVWYNDSTQEICFYTNCSVVKDIKMIVSNGCFADTCSFVANVTMNSAPLVIAVPDTAVTLCQPQDVCVAVGIADADYNVNSISVSPAGFYNRFTGTVCVSVDTSGLYHIVVSATDDCGATGVDSFYINADINQAPVVTSANDTTIFQCVPADVCLPVAVADADNNLLSVATQNATFDSINGAWCLSPADTGGVFTVVTAAVDECGLTAVDTTVVTIIVNSAPVTTIASDTSVSLCAPEEVCIPLSVFDADGNLAIVSPSAGAWYDESRQSICFVAGRSGDFTFETTAVDSCGAYVRTRTTVHVAINSAPVVVAGVDTAVTGCVLQEVCIPVGISDSDYNLDPVNVTVSPIGSYDPITGLVCLTPNDTGSIAVIVTATDDCGVTGADTTWVGVDLTPGPSIECPQIPISAFTCGGDTVCQTLNIAPTDASVTVSGGAWYSDGKVCFVSDTAGFYQFEIIATASCGADTCVISFNVTQDETPQFTCPPDTALFLCEPGQICVPVGTLPSNAQVAVTPMGSYDAGVVCFQADTSGRYVITLTAMTDCGADTCTFAADVTINDGPTISHSGGVALRAQIDTTVQVCDPGQQEVCVKCTVSDVNANIANITVPQFASYTLLDSTLTVCFTPDSSGAYGIWIQVADSCGASDFDTVVVNVMADSTPVIVCPDTIVTEFCDAQEVCYPITVAPASAQLLSPDGLIRNDSICIALDTSGIYAATVIAENDCGADTCEVVVKATLLTAPAVTCPADTTLFSCAPDTVCLPFSFAPQSAFVSVTGPAYLDMAQSQICVPVVGDTTMTITVRSQISCGTAECTFTVTTVVNDPPLVALPDDFGEFQCTFDSICIPVTISDSDKNIADVVTNRGVYDPVRGVVCFAPPTIGSYAVIVTATDSCGATGVDTVNVTVTTGIAADIVCPQGLQTASLCAPGEVCLLMPITQGIDSVVTSIGAYNPISKSFCFTADTSGTYMVDVYAFAPCGNDTCQFVVRVDITPTPTLSCPAPIDTMLCVSQTDSLCVNIGMVAGGSTVEVSPIGAYDNGFVCFPVDTPGVYNIDVLASTICGADSCTLTVTVDDNNAPNLNVPTTLSIPRCPEDTGRVCLSGIFATDDEGDPVTLTKICGPGDLTITGDNTADICFVPVSADSTYEFCIQASDGCHTRTESFFVTVFPANDCGVCLTVSLDGPECTPVGQEVNVLVNAETKEQIGGYDLLISYDPSALAFLFADIGSDISNWEYFTYRQGPFGACQTGCPNGLVRLVAIADINDGGNHPPGDALLPQGSLASLRFRIANDQTLGNQFVPVNFYWLDCGDNGFSDPSGQFLFIDQRIFNHERALLWDENDDARYPESSRTPGLGAGDDCLSGEKFQPIRCVDFINGGICIINPDSIDARGDVNLNAIPYEVADAVVYTNYFIVGISAFIFSVEGQTAASDVNADGATLTVADLVYLVRVIIGDASPIPKSIPGGAGANVALERDGDSFTVTSQADVNIGAAHLVFEYDGTPPESITLGEGAAGMDLAYSINDGVINALIYEDASHASGRVINSGPSDLMNINMNTSGSSDFRLVNAELTDEMGWRVINANIETKVVPERFELAQNYPNPFNPSTVIEMALPQKTDWTLTIYNMLGQRVRKFDGASEAGILRVKWDGKDFRGNRVASGIYLYQAKAGASVATRKMMLLK